MPNLTSSGYAWVEPAAPIQPGVTTLSAIDNLCSKVYPTGVWFFPLADDADPLFHYDQLKRGLQRLIYQMPYLAGYLKEDDRGFYTVIVPAAPEAGVRFYYRDLSKDDAFPTLQALKDGGFPLCDGNKDGLGKLHPDNFPTCADGDPVMLAQLTRIRGGIVVMACVTHLLGDLQQPRVLCSSWASQTEAVSAAHANGEPEPELPEPFDEELLDRSQLTPKFDKPLPMSEIKKIASTLNDVVVIDPEDPEAAMEILQNITVPAHVPESRMSDEDSLRECVVGMWLFPAADLKALQKIAQDRSSQRVSINDAIAGFLWQRYYASKYAIGHHAVNGEVSKKPSMASIVFPGDIRPRLEPPLPDAYLGAAVDMFKASIPPADMEFDVDNEDAFGRALAQVANANRNALSHWDKHRLLTAVNLIMQMPFMTPMMLKGPMDLLITDHSRTPDAARGDWGPGLGISLDFREPYFARDVPIGEITIMARKPNGDLQVMIAGEKITLERLINDKLMNRYSSNMYICHDVPTRFKEQTVPRARL